MAGSQDIRKDVRCRNGENEGRAANRPGKRYPIMAKDCSKFA